MAATVYRAKTGDELLAEAQRVLDEHVTSSADGRRQDGHARIGAAPCCQRTGPRCVLGGAGGVRGSLPYLAQFHTSAAPHLPPSMAGELARLVVRAGQATAGLA
jgi:hypothetical protein